MSYATVKRGLNLKVRSSFTFLAQTCDVFALGCFASCQAVSTDKASVILGIAGVCLNILSVLFGDRLL